MKIERKRVLGKRTCWFSGARRFLLGARHFGPSLTLPPERTGGHPLDSAGQFGAMESRNIFQVRQLSLILVRVEPSCGAAALLRCC